jgi:hypothetical protein
LISAYSALAVRRSRFGLCASAFNACLSVSWNAVSLVGRSLRWYFGGPSTSPCSHFATVLRESPVMREISRSDLFFQACKRRILPIMSMVITPCPLLHKKTAE